MHSHVRKSTQARWRCKPDRQFCHTSSVTNVQPRKIAKKSKTLKKIEEKKSGKK
jgi:hypothetical protein